MIIVRAPLRVSFVGGGTDLPDFYRESPGRVISTAINKYVYVVINPIPMINKVIARYSIVEVVDHARELKNNRIREALLDAGIESNMEIATLSHVPVGSGLGSSSSFSVALIKGIAAYQGKRLEKGEVAEAASRLEIERVGDPIGKQDQYAAAVGGFNVLQFNPNHTVDVDPLLMHYTTRLDLERHLLLFFTGITRAAATVLTEQRANIGAKRETLRAMADSVFGFRDTLLAGEFKKLGELLHEGWLRKRGLAGEVSNSVVDQFYEAGISAGAWGGKVSGAGGGGCMLFMTSPERRAAVRAGLMEVARANNLGDAREIPFQFVQSGVEVLLNGDQPGDFGARLA